MQIVQEFANHYKNLRIIHLVNSGVSVARNVGLQVAKGEYVIFIDADDWILENSLKKICALLEEKKHIQLDLLLLLSESTDGTIYYPWENKCIDGQIYKGTDAFSNGFRRGSVCGGVYNREFLFRYNILFPEGVRNGEDSIFINLVLVYAVSVCFERIPFYVVYERVGSASRTFNVNHLKLMVKSLDYIKKMMDKRLSELTIIQRDMLTELLYAQISTLTYTAIAVGNIPLYRIKQNMVLENYLPIHFEGKNNKGWKLILLNFSYSLYYWLIKLKVLLT